MKLALSVCVLLGLTVCVAGCGGPNLGTPLTVKGKVTVGGAPAKDVNIIFQAKVKLPADKRTAQAAVKPDGTYEVTNVYPADYDVMLQSTAPVDLKQNSAIPTAAAPVTESGTPVTKQATVAAGKTDLNFEF